MGRPARVGSEAQREARSVCAADHGEARVRKEGAGGEACLVHIARARGASRQVVHAAQVARVRPLALAAEAPERRHGRVGVDALLHAVEVEEEHLGVERRRQPAEPREENHPLAESQSSCILPTPPPPVGHYRRSSAASGGSALPFCSSARTSTYAAGAAAPCRSSVRPRG